MKPTRHEIRLDVSECDEVYEGIKPFIILPKAAVCQKGDLIEFVPIAIKQGVAYDGRVFTYFDFVDHPIIDKVYQITSIVSGRGFSPEYVVLGIWEIEL